MPQELKEFTLESLREYDGQDGRPAYIAHQDRVIDVSASKRWKNGLHMNRHHAGGDLTPDLAAAPHDQAMLDRCPQVGVLKKEAPEPEDSSLPLFARVMLDAFPMLQRHPHPMTVHFPIVTMIFTAVFSFLYVTSGVKSFETTAFHLLGAGVFFTLVAMITGLLTWRLNYLARPMKEVSIKLTLSVVMLFAAAGAFIWRCLEPDILDRLDGTGLVYLGLVLLLFPLVSIIGYFGAELTFPTHGGRGDHK
ncbi:MAG: DUF2231 domain-containing protein [Pseudomonadota bacterium]